MKILLTGGGTGGHIVPLLAVAQELKKQAQNKGILETEFLFLGPKIEEIYIKELLSKEGIIIKRILSGKFRRYFSVENFFSPFKTFFGFFQTLWILFFFMPDVIFSKGGFGSVNPVIVGWLYRIPILIHESDSIPGLANLKLSKYANKIAVSFPKVLGLFPEKKTALTGNPIRIDIINGSPQEAQKLFSLTGEKPILLIINGSQGSVRINDFILIALQEILKTYEIIHLCGEKNFESVQKESASQLKKQNRYYHLYSSLKNDLKHAYAAADLIIARSGANVIFEIAAVGKPSILIPLPESAQNHQLENAFQYSRSGAAIVIEEINLKPHLFLDSVNQIISDNKTYKEMSDAAKAFAKPEASRKIAEELLNLSGVL